MPILKANFYLPCIGTEQAITPVANDAVSCGESCSGENRSTYLQGLEDGENFTKKTNIIHSISTPTANSCCITHGHFRR